jgi:hypothetical protein
MKKVKLFFTAVAVLAVVGGAVAFKAAKTNRDILQCVSGLCAAQPSTDNYSTSGSTKATPPFTPYTGSTGAVCGSQTCSQFTGQVFIND